MNLSGESIMIKTFAKALACAALAAVAVAAHASVLQPVKIPSVSILPASTRYSTCPAKSA